MADIEDEFPLALERDARFWLTKEQRRDNLDPHQIVDAFVDSLKSWFEERQTKHVEYLRAYGLSYDNYGQAAQKPNDDMLRINVLGNIVDTAVNKVCKSRILPMAITVGGSISERKRAEKFNRFIAGLFMETGAYEKDYQWTSDAFICDCGIAKVVEKDERVGVERCQVDHVYWDPEEAMLTGEVSVIAEDHFMDRFQLVELVRKWDAKGKLYGDEGGDNLRNTIRAVMSVQYDGKDNRYFRRPNQHDVVRVREAWHAKSSQDADDGCHVISINNRTLVREDYDDVRVPHILLTRKVPLYGLTSPGLIADCLPIQREHDDITERLRESHATMGVPRILLLKGSSMSLASLDDVPGTVIQVDSMDAVKEWNAQPANEQVYAYRQQQVSDMQLVSGVPEMNMTGKVPDGITAAKALAMLDDVVSEKLSQPLRQREAFFVKIAERCLDAVRKIAKRHRGKYVVKSENGRFLEELNLKDIDIPFGSYRLRCFPTNFLSQTPSVRYDRLSEMRQRGDINEMEFRALSEIPDLEAENDLETAPQDIVDLCIDAILTKDKSFVAEAFDDHQLIVLRGGKSFNLARVQAPSPEEDPDAYKVHVRRLKNLTNYIMSAMNWLQPPASAPGVAGVGQGPPPAQPMPPGMDAMMQGPPGQPMPPNQSPPTNPFGPSPAEAMSNGPR